MATLVGLIDQPIEISDIKAGRISYEVNRVGGEPSWFDPKLSLPVQLCRQCSNPQSLVAQVYCPLAGSAYHRILFVYACPWGMCSHTEKGWRVLRAQRYDSTYDDNVTKKQSSQVQQQPAMDTDMWADGADDWGDDADDWGGGADNWGEETNSIGQDDPDGGLGMDGATSAQSEVSRGEHVVQNQLQSSMAASASLNCSRETEESEEMATEALAQMSISDNASNTSTFGGRGDSSVGATDGDQVVEEELLLPNSERWDAMARILNTKLDPVVQTAPMLCHDPMVFQSYYLDVDEEPEEEHDVPREVLALIKKYEKDQLQGNSVTNMAMEMQESGGRTKSGKGGRSGGNNEKYEKTQLCHGDQEFHKFLKRLQRCPEQCVRYNRGGPPLLIRELSVTTQVDLCPTCGSQRIFELQLLSSLIPWMKPLRADHCNIYEFGTVLIFTCMNSCWPEEGTEMNSGPLLLEEAVIVQEDPDGHLFKSHPML